MLGPHLPPLRPLPFPRPCPPCPQLVVASVHHKLTTTLAAEWAHLQARLLTPTSLAGGLPPAVAAAGGSSLSAAAAATAHQTSRRTRRRSSQEWTGTAGPGSVRQMHST